MKLKILSLILFVLPFFTKGQVSLTLQPAGHSILLKDQLWNMVLTNNSDDFAEVRIEADVTDVLTGQSLLNAGTSKIILGKGMKVITIRDLQPILYNYVSSEFSGTYVPCGNYNIHYRVIAQTFKGDETVAAEVIRVNVNPLSPPMLITPLDRSSSEILYPQFAWMPPTPSDIFYNLVYNINVVAIEEGQTAKEAMELNQPVYFNGNIQTSSDKMPTSFSQLETGKTYAWQIHATSGLSCTSASEVWIFTIGKDSASILVEQAPYTKISKVNTEVTTVQEGVIKIEYYNSSGENKAVFNIYKASDKKKKKLIQFESTLTPGQNYIMYNAGNKLASKENTVYEISMVNKRGEEWLMRVLPVYYKNKKSLQETK